MTSAIAPIDKIPVAINPLYSAFMMPLSGPSRTKNVPMTEVTMHAAPMTSGNSSILSRNSGDPPGAGAKKIAASSIVATIVTT